MQFVWRIVHRKFRFCLNREKDILVGRHRSKVWQVGSTTSRLWRHLLCLSNRYAKIVHVQVSDCAVFVVAALAALFAFDLEGRHRLDIHPRRYYHITLMLDHWLTVIFVLVFIFVKLLLDTQLFHLIIQSMFALSMILSDLRWRNDIVNDFGHSRGIYPVSLIFWLNNLFWLDIWRLVWHRLLLLALRLLYACSKVIHTLIVV